MDIRTRIKLARKEAGYRSQREFAPVIGVERETLGRYESNEDSLTLEAVRNIAKATSKPLAWFFLEPGYRLEHEHGRSDLAPLTRARQKVAELDAELQTLEESLLK